MSRAPAVSVLMPVHNGEKYLGEAIESILNQTFCDYEFVIINDGSTDGTQDILSDYERREERIRVLSQQRQGLAATLNLGLEMARGEYIARMDADDISHPERLATQVTYLQKHPEVGLAGTNCYPVDSAGTVGGGPFPGRSLDGSQVVWDLYWGNPIVHPSVMYRATDVIACDGYPTGYSYYAEDLALWFKVVSVTEVAVLQRPLLHLRKHQRNVTAVDTAEHLAEVAEVAQSALEVRLGYRPSTSSVRLLRGAQHARPVAEDDIRDSVCLLRDAFEQLVSSGGLEGQQIRSIEADMYRRMLRLATLSTDRSYSLEVCRHVARHSPRRELARLAIEAVLGRLFSR